MKPRKAYLVQDSHSGFGFRLSPVIVLNHTPGAKLATVALLNVTSERAWIPTLGTDMTVPVSHLAGTRLRALAKIAARLLDLETELNAHFAVTPAAPAPAPQPAVAAPARATASPHPTPGGPRRHRAPWWQEQ